jgi:hypothetical protein
MKIKVNWEYFRRVWLLIGYLSIGLGLAIAHSYFVLMWRDKLIFSGPEYHRDIGFIFFLGRKVFILR